MIADNFRIRCSSIHRIMATMKPAGLTSAEKADLELHERYEAGTELTATGQKAKFTDKRKARLSELRHLKANPRKPELPAGAKTLCDEWLQDEMYQRRRSFGAKQTEKGTRTEDDGIDLLRDYLEDPFLPEKNAWRVVGEFIEGECDLHYAPWVHDIKSCYTHAVMDLYATEAIKAHYNQLQGYGSLYRTPKLGLVRVLCDMPEDMIAREAYYATKAQFGPDHTERQLQDNLDRLTRRYTYDDLPLAMRVHITPFAADPDFIAQVVERVKMCREYINKRFAELPKHKRKPAERYVSECRRKAHYADVKRTEENAKAWRAANWIEAEVINLPEGAQMEVA